MSNGVTHYVMVGANIGYKDGDDFYEQFTPYMDEGSKELFCLFDGMDGKYVILGEVISTGNEYEGLKYKEILWQDIEVKANRVRTTIKEIFGLDTQPKLIFVSHWH